MRIIHDVFVVIDNLFLFGSHLNIMLYSVQFNEPVEINLILIC